MKDVDSEDEDVIISTELAMSKLDTAFNFYACCRFSPLISNNRALLKGENSLNILGKPLVYHLEAVALIERKQS